MVWINIWIKILVYKMPGHGVRVQRIDLKAAHPMIG